MSKSTQTQQAQYFNLHTTGIGYLNSIREVAPKKGNPFLSCNIAALTGESSSPEYRYFNVNVAGEDSNKLIRRCQQAVESKKKVLISFVIADLCVDSFIYDKDSDYHKKGDVGVMLKGRLIRIKSITIDGNKVYQEQANNDEQSSQVPAQRTQAAPKYRSKPTEDADFGNTPPKYQQKSRPARVAHQSRAVAPKANYPQDSF